MTSSTTDQPSSHAFVPEARTARDRAVPDDAYPLMVMALTAPEEHVLVVVGEADISTADHLRDQIVAALAARPAAVRVQLDGLDFCDSRGLAALHDAARAADAAGVPMTFHGASPQLAWLQRTFPS